METPPYAYGTQTGVNCHQQTLGRESQDLASLVLRRLQLDRSERQTDYPSIRSHGGRALKCHKRAKAGVPC